MTTSPQPPVSQISQGLPAQESKRVRQVWLDDCIKSGWCGNLNDWFGAFEWSLQHNLALAERVWANQHQIRPQFLLPDNETSSPHPLLSVHAHQPQYLPQLLERYGLRASAIVLKKVIYEFNDAVSQKLKNEEKIKKQIITDFVKSGMDFQSSCLPDGTYTKTILTHAFNRDFRWKVIQTLIDLGFDIHEKYECGRTYLHGHSMQPSNRIIKLIKSGIDPNIQDDEGNTALHYACAIRPTKLSESMVERLWKITNLDLKNDLNQTPADVLVAHNPSLWHRITSQNAKKGLLLELGSPVAKSGALKKM